MPDLPTLAHDDAGSGDPVLLVHAGVCDRRMWDPQWPMLTTRFRVIRCDLRGFGETRVPPERFNHADDLRRLLDSAEVEAASVVGASFGAEVALELASRWPDRVARLIVLSANWDGIEPGSELLRFGGEEDRLLEAGDVDAAVELNVETWLGPDAGESARGAVRRMQRRAFELQLATPAGAEEEASEWEPGTIAASTLVLSGAKDLGHFRQVAAALASRIPNAKHLELDWAAHLPSLERPAEVSALLLKHLGTVERR